MNQELELDFTGSPKDHPFFSDLRPHIVEKFFEYHKANPKIYDLFKRFARELRTAGRENYGAKAIAERIRWHTMVESKDEDFKMGNNYPACYSRLLMIDDKTFVGFFRTRHTPGTVTDSF